MFKGWFKKKTDVIDLTQKRRVEAQPAESSSQTAGSGGYADLTNAGNLEEENVDLFSAISNSTEAGEVSNTSIKHPSPAVNNRLEDVEFKLDSLRKKIDDVLNRIEVIEKKAGVYGS